MLFSARTWISSISIPPSLSGVWHTLMLTLWFIQSNIPLRTFDTHVFSPTAGIWRSNIGLSSQALAENALNLDQVQQTTSSMLANKDTHSSKAYLSCAPFFFAMATSTMAALSVRGEQTQKSAQRVYLVRSAINVERSQATADSADCQLFCTRDHSGRSLLRQPGKYLAR